jgi:hypothetical protein
MISDLKHHAAITRRLRSATLSVHLGKLRVRGDLNFQGQGQTPRGRRKFARRKGSRITGFQMRLGRATMVGARRASIRVWVCYPLDCYAWHSRGEDS